MISQKLKNTLKTIFDKENVVIINKELKKRYYELTGMEISEIYQYILEHYSNIVLNENYGYNAIEKSPFAGDGLDTFSDFIGLVGDSTVFTEYKVYKEQLPIGYYPIAHIDGGNLICINSNTGSIYTWLHDENEDNCLFLAQKNLEDFIKNIVKEDSNNIKKDLGINNFHFSDELWNAIKNFKG